MSFMLEKFSEMLAELSRREKEANIKPDPDIDIYMKVIMIGKSLHVSSGQSNSSSI